MILRSIFAVCVFPLFASLLLAQGDSPKAEPENSPIAQSDEPVQTESASKTRLVVVRGAGGTEEFDKQFALWTERWNSLAAETDQVEIVSIHKSDQTDAKSELKNAIESSERVEALWIILIGHGTDNQKVAKFNLIGPDVSASELGEWLAGVDRPIVLVNCASSSGGFIARLKREPAGKNRVIVTSTKSGAQYNFARFGDYFSNAIVDPDLDLDKDGQTSLLEAFIAASKETQDFYSQEKRLATELALIDDNQDGLGTPGDWFSGTRIQRRPKKGEPDGELAGKMILVRRGDEAKLTLEQRQQRDRIEAKIDKLRSEKKLLTEDDYYSRLQSLMVEMARVYEADSDQAKNKQDEEKLDGNSNSK